MAYSACRKSLGAILLTPLFAAFAAAANLPRVTTSNHGTITQPPAQTHVSSGASIPFSYQDSNWCEGGYSPISVWLLASSSAPTTANLNASGKLPESDATYYLGAFTVPNFGLPANGNTLPPASLTVPDVSGYASGSDLYLAVVETANTCPPGNQPAQYGMTSVQLVIA
ncbi:hypothetical protein B0H15DRAFT_851797 [Mycena belliarum]|uniref:Uncharacterized protein n=1 Tax=Mycena belliarum TaxID=1033014 RepID=A0AAD6TYM0_9AGAR|nr:hypothetical protein B0H15DRAFT_851797 [Mycena belliae]